ncbi:hypothetical protein ACFQBP_38235, partial [Paraburkholderia dipogonis]
MIKNTPAARLPVSNTELTVRRKFLTSLLAGGGAFVLAACGGGGDSASPDAVADRYRRGGASN